MIRLDIHLTALLIITPLINYFNILFLSLSNKSMIKQYDEYKTYYN